VTALLGSTISGGSMPFFGSIYAKILGVLTVSTDYLEQIGGDDYLKDEIK